MSHSNERKCRFYKYAHTLKCSDWLFRSRSLKRERVWTGLSWIYFCPMPFLLASVTFAETTRGGLFSDMDWILANWGDNKATYKSDHIFLSRSRTEVISGGIWWTSSTLLDYLEAKWVVNSRHIIYMKVTDVMGYSLHVRQCFKSFTWPTSSDSHNLCILNSFYFSVTIKEARA